MRRREKIEAREIRRYRTENGKICIEIRLKSTTQLFDVRDPAPFRERDLDDNAVRYIVSAAEEFSTDTPLKLLIHVEQTPAEAMEPAGMKEAVHSFFSYEAELLRRRLKRTLKTARFFLLIGLSALVICLGLAELTNQLEWLPLRSILREGLIISGWVAMWRPLELFLYDWWPLATQTKVYEKLSGIEIEFRRLN